jgi:carbamoyltransferase
LVNTSFNVRGEPIVCTPEDAYRCFMRTEMDYLVLESFLLAKTDQPKRESDESWKQEFELD